MALSSFSLARRSKSSTCFATAASRNTDTSSSVTDLPGSPGGGGFSVRYALTSRPTSCLISSEVNSSFTTSDTSISTDWASMRFKASISLRSSAFAFSNGSTASAIRSAIISPRAFTSSCIGRFPLLQRLTGELHNRSRHHSPLFLARRVFSRLRLLVRRKPVSQRPQRVVLMLAPQRIAASGRPIAKLSAALVRRDRHSANQLGHNLRLLAKVHPQQRAFVKLNPKRARNAKPLVQKAFHALHNRAQGALVVVRSHLVHLHARRNLPDPHHVRRNLERLADLTVGILELLHKLRIGSLEGERRKPQVGTDHSDLAAILAAVPFIERGLDCVGLFLRQAGGRGNQAAGTCVVAEERRTVAENLEILASRQRS